jgi:hypothetical protein
VSDERAPVSPARLRAIESTVVGWLDAQREANPLVLAVEADPDTERLWVMRLEGEDKPVITVWFHLRQRSLIAESHFMPAPLERHDDVWEYLLRRNHGLRGLSYSIGPEDAVYLTGRLPVEWVDDAHLDRLLGGIYEATEASFGAAMRLGYGHRFTR